MHPMQVATSPAAQPKERLHFLDWGRTTLIFYVVYAHLCYCTLRPYGEIQVDNHAFASAFANATERNDLHVRWSSYGRQQLVPTLFWVSGAAMGCSFRNSLPKHATNVAKIAGITVVGMLGNLAVWMLGPMDPTCTVSNPCPGKGLAFDFTDVPYQGVVLQVLNQMWFTACLATLLALYFPLLRAMAQRSPVYCLVQWGCSAAAFLALLYAHSAGDPDVAPVTLFAWLAGFEALFLAAAVGATMDAGARAGVPVRALHYVCALAAVGQVSASPIMGRPSGFSMGHVVYLACMASKCFLLGFVMIYTRASAGPLLSNYWPVLYIMWTHLVPSTNHSMSGILAYPYFERAPDRCLYFAGGVATLFITDFISRDKKVPELPAFLNYGGLLMYLVHPFLMVSLIQLGIRDLLTLWFAIAAICFGGAWVVGWVLARRSRAPRAASKASSEGGSDETSSDSESDS